MVLRFVLSIFTLITWVAPVMAEEFALKWEAVQPFRFFRYESDQAIQRWAFDDAAKASNGDLENIVSGMEAKLNSETWWNAKPEGAAVTRLEQFQSLRRQEFERLKRPYIKFDPRLGWASMLRDEEGASPARGTCWNSEAKSYTGCVSDIGQMMAGNRDDYILPKRHIVSLKVEGAAVNAHRCRYGINAKPVAGFGFVPEPLFRGPEMWTFETQSCAEPIYLKIPNGASYSIRVEIDGNQVPELHTDVSVKDYLVVGIGDSFGSGEGNPEVPAKLDQTKGIEPYVGVAHEQTNSADFDFVVPTREKLPTGAIKAGTAARWLDDQCHRSVYSAQARTAIALSLMGDRHHAITFVSYACSGAEISDGLFWPQDHRECVKHSPAGDRLHQPQISGVIDALAGAQAKRAVFPLGLDEHDLYYKQYLRTVERRGTGPGLDELRKTRQTCASWPAGSDLSRHPLLKTGHLRRPIDLLLVSIGGNDIGFGPLVTTAVVNSGILRFALPFITDRTMVFYQKAAGGITLKDAGDRIENLDSRFRMLDRAIREKLEISDPARVIFTAYPKLTRSKHGFCKTGNTGMNVSTLFSTNEQSGPDNVTPEDADNIVNKLNSSLAAIAQRYDWTFVDSHVEKFEGHSFCDFELGLPGSRQWSEVMDTPHRVRTLANDWIALTPTTTFYPYASRERWVRTFNDAYLLSYYFKGFATEAKPQKRDLFGAYQAQRALGGPMHPSAEGHSHIADSMLRQAAKVLFAN
ncbi:SGNH/GDSL hydrolase family protein [Rhizobium ruizarguesonis]|uniref:hypothetical protein n=1 Tax=Rhizobium ruizarguesonis TaxID=2081791 RepID=UPI00102F9A01|nr:hypothetical protein [Rhizobium ruizarguesonis]TAZ23395.1 hypothetical protein ELH74_37665 [Rhizobium ruizarguesonis]TBD07701.1 hypothetical protein ELH23_38945 [Rhizobium ruizarguesonis]